MKRLLFPALLLVLVLSALLVKAEANARPADASASTPSTYLVLIVLDGGLPSYLSAPNTPNLHTLITKGTQYSNAFAGLLESETPSGHAAIGTGSIPKDDGILGFWWANSDNLPVSMFSPARVLAGDMERIIKGSGATTIAGLVHRKNMSSKVVALSGNKYYAADAMGGPNADSIMYFTSNGTTIGPRFIPGHPPPANVFKSSRLTIPAKNYPLGSIDHLAINLAIDSFKREHQLVTLINLPEFDWPLGHVYGASKDQWAVNTLMQSFDRDLGSMEAVYKQAGVLSRTVFLVTADHGFTDLIHKIPQSEIANAVSKTGTSIVSQTNTTGNYIWIKDQSKAAAAATNIAKLHDKFIQSVYARVKTKNSFVYQRVSSSRSLLAPNQEAANQYLLQSFNGPNAPDIAVIFDEGVGVEPNGQANWKADHGGASWLAQHIPLVIKGPGVRKGYVSSSPARLEDLAPTALTLIGVPVIGMKGIVLADAFNNPPNETAQLQSSLNHQLVPVVTSMQVESALELHAGR